MFYGLKSSVAVFVSLRRTQSLCNVRSEFSVPGPSGCGRGIHNVRHWVVPSVILQRSAFRAGAVQVGVQGVSELCRMLLLDAALTRECLQC